MVQPRTVGRREFLMATITFGSLAGCLGTQGDQPGVVDGADFSIQPSESGKLTVTNVQKDNNTQGVKLSTKDSVTDGRVVAEVPTSIPRVSKSTVYINVDVSKIDDDTEVEIRFQSAESGYRSLYIGNEYKAKKNGVLATKTGSSYSLQKKFQKLPGSEKVNTGQIQNLKYIQVVIRDGDFQGTIWDLGFMFEDRTIGIL